MIATGIGSAVLAGLFAGPETIVILFFSVSLSDVVVDAIAVGTRYLIRLINFFLYGRALIPFDP